jgi:hypothetical protein
LNLCAARGGDYAIRTEGRLEDQPTRVEFLDQEKVANEIMVRFVVVGVTLCSAD